MKALICDKCGKTMHIREVRCGVTIKIYADMIEPDYVDLDLCESCSKELFSFNEMNRIVNMRRTSK